MNATSPIDQRAQLVANMEQLGKRLQTVVTTLQTGDTHTQNLLKLIEQNQQSINTSDPTEKDLALLSQLVQFVYDLKQAGSMNALIPLTTELQQKAHALEDATRKQDKEIAELQIVIDKLRQTLLTQQNIKD